MDLDHVFVDHALLFLVNGGCEAVLVLSLDAEETIQLYLSRGGFAIDVCEERGEGLVGFGFLNAEFLIGLH